jgi:hypothetical protein
VGSEAILVPSYAPSGEIKRGIVRATGTKWVKVNFEKYEIATGRGDFGWSAHPTAEAYEASIRRQRLIRALRDAVNRPISDRVTSAQLELATAALGIDVEGAK